MAAEFLLTFVMEESLKKLSSVGVDWISRTYGLTRELKKLDATTKMIQDVLQDAEEKQERDVRVKDWLEKFQDVVYSAGDVLDEFSYETLRYKVEIQGRLKLKEREFVSRNNPIFFRLTMANKLKKINESLVDIEREASHELTLRAIARGDREVAIESNLLDRKTDSFLDRSETPIDRTRYVERIINMLQAGSSNPPFFTFIYIVGIGGIGKTTLAKLVLQEVKKKKLFYEIMWVCVSDSFDYQRVLIEMLQKLDKSTGALGGDDAIIHHLRMKLKNKKFLLVLDDVWDDESDKWNRFMTRLGKIYETNGNFVIMTTRKTSVTKVMDNTASQYLVKLEGLSHKACWSIIKNKFLEKWKESASMPKEFEAVGIEIAKKCGGVTLFAQVLGGTLSLSKDREFWSSIQKNNALEAIDRDKGILSVLKLSFDHLSSPLRRCFAYCSLFPKDYVYKKEVQLWMAEEFFIEGSSSMEDIGEEYFNSFLANSFFQDVKVDSWGNIIECKMHDLLHDLALYVSNSEALQVGSCYISKTRDGRHLTVACIKDSTNPEFPKLATNQGRKLRSLFSDVDATEMLPNFKSLRSLCMCVVETKELPFMIRKLKHLRYLDISGNKRIEELPKDIEKLYKLQTLRLLECKNLKKLPDGIGNWVSLQHMYFDDKRLMTFKVTLLNGLRTLPFFVVGLEDGYKVCELKGLNKLRGELEISNLESVRDAEKAKKAELEKKKLSKLILIWNEVEENEREYYSSFKECNHEDVLASLRPVQGLLSLIIKCYMGKEFPLWMSMRSTDSLYPLKKLVNLELKNCKKCKKMSTLGHLCHLKVLVVEGMDSMKSIGNEFYGESNNMDILFPALEKFSIEKMKSLVEWTTTVGAELFPKLRELYIENCPCLTSFPLSQTTSSSIGINIDGSHMGGDLVTIWCIIPDLKSLENILIQECPKLTFSHIGLTYFQDLRCDLRDSVLSLSIFSNRRRFRRSWKVMWIVGAVKIIREFPKSLEILNIRRVKINLSADAFHGLSSLKDLKIKGCHSLQSIPTLSSLTSLEYLEIKECDSLESIPTLSSLTSLYVLRIEYCRNLSDLSQDCFPTLPRLKKLYISFCPKLRSVPCEIKLCTSLKELCVRNCGELVSIDDDMIGSLTQLKILEWGSFSNELNQVPGFNSTNLLTSLEKVLIEGWDKLTSLPHQLQHLTSIRELEIRFFSGVETLPDWLGLGNLSSLESLSISYCQNLKNLPTALQRLSKLKRLVISDCPLLKERCARDTVPQCSDIRHIPHLEIRDRRSRRNSYLELD